MRNTHAQDAHAQDALAQTDVDPATDTTCHSYELGEIVIYGERIAARTSMTVEFSAEQLDELGAPSIAAALRSEPALSITTGPKAETETRIRGFPAFNTLVRVDGHPVNPGYYGKVDLSMLPVDNIETLEVIKGPASVAYGVNSMGGVVDINTRRGTETPVTVFNSAFGDYRYRRLSLSHSNRTGMFTYRLAGYENRSQGFALSRTYRPTDLEVGGLRDHSSYHKSGGDMRVGARVGKDIHLELSASYHRAKKDVPSTVYSWDSPTYRTFPEYERLNAALSSQWFPGEHILVKAQVFFDSYNDRLIDYKTAERNDNELNYDSYLGSWSAGGYANAEYLLSTDHNLQLGLQLATDRMEKRPNTGLPLELHSIEGGHIFLQDTYTPWEATEFIAGCIASFSRRETAKDVSTAFSPMLSIRHRLPYEFIAYASYANSIRYPSLHHLYSVSSGNPDLLPQSADKLEAGLRRTFIFDKPSVSVLLEVALFHNALDNLIYRSNNSYRFKNIASTTLQGLESRIHCAFSNVITAEIGYMLLDRNASSSEIMEETSPQTLRIQLSARSSFGLQASYEFRDTGIRTTHVPAWQLSPYRIHTIRLAQELFDRVRLTLEIDNLTDTDYEDELGYPAPGRQFIAGFQYTLK